MRRALLAVVALAAVWVLPAVPASAESCALGTRAKGVTYERSTALDASSVVMYGDSITYQMARRLGIRHPDVGLDAYWGRPTLHGVETLARDMFKDDQAPDVVIMAVGTNDTGHPESVGSLVRYTRDLLPRTTRLLWVNAYTESRPGWDKVNMQISGVPQVEVIDWAARNLRERGRGGQSALLQDGVHLSCKGADAWLRLLEASLHNRVNGVLAPLSDQAAERRYV